MRMPVRRFVFLLAVPAAVALSPPTQAADRLAGPRLPAPSYGGWCLDPYAVQIAGTAGCIRISGDLRADFGTPVVPSRGAMSSPAVPFARSDITRSSAEARLGADVRVPTELGPLRAYVRLRSRR